MSTTLPVAATSAPVEAQLPVRYQEVSGTQVVTEEPTPTTVPTLQPIQDIQPAEAGEQAPPARGIPVLEYRRGASYRSPDGSFEMRPEWFAKQMRWLAQNGYRSAAPDELAAFLDAVALPSRKPVVIKLSTDSGSTRQDFVEHVIPALKENGLTGYLFVAIGDIAEACDGERICWDDLKAWQEEGVLTIESQGLDSRAIYWGDSTQAGAAAEESKAVIERILAQPVYYFAFPDGSRVFDPGYLVEAGYLAAFSSRRQDREVQSTLFMGSILFGDKDRFSLPAYLPYSNENSYPRMASTWIWQDAEFGDMLETAIARPAPAGSAPTEDERTAAWKAVTEYCDHNRHEMNGGKYLDTIPFYTDLSPDAQEKLNGFVEVRPTCYFEPGNQPRFIVLHYTQGYLGEALNTFRGERGVGIHYLVDMDGSVVQMVPENIATYHAGCNGGDLSCLPTCIACEKDGRRVEPFMQSIGIEIVNPGPLYREGVLFFDKNARPYFGPVFPNSAPLGGNYLYKYQFWGDYTYQQTQALRALILDIQSRWPIEAVLGHSEIQYKADPGPALETFTQVANGFLTPQSAIVP